MKRPGQLKRGRPRRRKTPIIWRLNLGPCAVCPVEGAECAGPVQGHHVVSQQALRRRGLELHLWDVRNRLPVCEHRHAQHTNGHRPIGYSLLPSEALAFAVELKLDWWVERHYPRKGDT